jgi:hypothetical protein
LREQAVNVKQNGSKAIREVRMTIAQKSEVLFCPHCGMTMEADEELCRACGRLMIAYAAPKVSFLVGFFGALGSWFREGLCNPDPNRSEISEINPATSLPVVGRKGGLGGVDIAGNAYGTDFE